MTAIAGLVHDGVVWIGADSAGVTGTSMISRADEKAFRLNGYVFGFTSSFRMGQLLRYRLNPPVPEGVEDAHLMEFMCTSFIDAVRDCLKEGGWAEKDKDRERGGNFLTGVSGRLFEIHGDYQVAERMEPYSATGCGKDMILGSLYTTNALGWDPGRRIVTALEAAGQFSTDVQAPFRVVSTGT